MSTSGVVTGAPPATAELNNLQVRVTDALGRTSTANVSIQVVNGCEGITTLDVAECLALVQFYRSTNGSGWEDSTGWLSGDPCSPWEGMRARGRT